MMHHSYSIMSKSPIPKTNKATKLTFSGIHNKKGRLGNITPKTDMLKDSCKCGGNDLSPKYNAGGGTVNRTLMITPQK